MSFLKMKKWVRGKFGGDGLDKENSKCTGSEEEMFVIFKKQEFEKVHCGRNDYMPRLRNHFQNLNLSLIMKKHTTFKVI